MADMSKRGLFPSLLFVSDLHRFLEKELLSEILAVSDLEQMPWVAAQVAPMLLLLLLPVSSLSHSSLPLLRCPLRLLSTTSSEGHFASSVLPLMMAWRSGLVEEPARVMK